MQKAVKAVYIEFSAVREGAIRTAAAEFLAAQESKSRYHRSSTTKQSVQGVHECSGAQ